MLNSSVSLGRCGVPVSYISEFSHDNVGNIILDFLMDNNVATEYLYIYEGKSPLALAFLNDRKDAEYDFYEEIPNERLAIDIPDFMPDDIVLFGSLLSVTEKTRDKLVEILTSAKNAGSLIVYDPNFRESQIPMLTQIKPLITENITFSDIVRASDEDMKMIYGCTDQEDAYDVIQENGCDSLIYTSSSNGVYLRTPLFSKHYNVPVIKTTSTVGAGDSFNAGLIFMLYSKNISDLDDVSGKQWDEIITTGIDFASCVCMSKENYISIIFASALKKA